ncbi:MAG: tRNA (adenosine(37)-N6)-threonylcarbamoyltransferase complex dimerization subunit type 1 TsaB [Desulfuromonadales bacterium]|nr:tRNA (adenosine(37)-N6)-threonylcarbamoyltransferase complex dimerization subunit type 1 TsaB [Desulfuromonadales bacterium]
MPPLILTMQTAIPAGGVAISDGEKLIAEINLDISKTATDWLLGTVDNLLDMAQVDRRDLDAIGIVRGPGSFTGLRVGLASAKGFALALDKPLLAVSSLKMLAMQMPFSRLPVCVMLDARKKEAYSATYSWESGHLEALTPERVLAPDLLLDEVDGEILCIGNGALVYKTLIVRRLGARAHFTPPMLNLPRIGAAAALALDEWNCGRMLTPEQLTPTYLRLSEAELNLRG